MENLRTSTALFAAMAKLQTLLQKKPRLGKAQPIELIIFRSGGGLRVARVDSLGPNGKDKLLAYGEDPQVEDALTMAGSVDVGKAKSMFWTGTSETSSNLDAFICRGSKLRAKAVQGGFEVALEGYGHHKMPDGMQDRILRTRASETHESRGYTYESSFSRFPNGEPCVSTKVIKAPEGRSNADPWMWQEKRVGVGKTLMEALDLAFEATPVDM